MASLTNEVPNQRSLKNGYHGSRSETLIQYKKREVSALRDFPPKCGTNAEPITPEALLDVIVCIDDHVSPVAHDNSSLRSFPSKCGIKAKPITPEALLDVFVCIDDHATLDNSFQSGIVVEENQSIVRGVKASGEMEFQENGVVQYPDYVAAAVANKIIETEVVDLGLPKSSERNDMAVPHGNSTLANLKNPMRAAQLERKMRMAEERVAKLALNEEVIPPLVEKTAEVSESPVTKEATPLKRKSKKKSASKSQDWPGKRARVGEFALVDESEDDGPVGETVGHAVARHERTLFGQPAVAADPEARTTERGEIFQVMVPEGRTEGPRLGLRELENIIGHGIKRAARDTYRLIQSHAEADERNRELVRQLEASKDAAKEIVEQKAKLGKSEQLVAKLDKEAAGLIKRAEIAEGRAEIAEGQAEVAVQEVVDLKAAYAASEDENLRTYFSGGLRAACMCICYEYPDAIPLDRLAAYTGVDQFDMKARTMHPLIPYSKRELTTLKKHDEDDQLPAVWPVPELKPKNLDTEMIRREVDCLEDELIEPAPRA